MFILNKLCVIFALLSALGCENRRDKEVDDGELHENINSSTLLIDFLSSMGVTVHNSSSYTIKIECEYGYKIPPYMCSDIGIPPGQSVNVYGLGGVDLEAASDGYISSIKVLADVFGEQYEEVITSMSLSEFNLEKTTSTDGESFTASTHWEYFREFVDSDFDLSR